MNRIVSTVLMACCLTACWSCGGEVNGTPSELVARGWQNFTLGDFPECEKNFTTALVQAQPAATAKQRHSALLGLASCYQLRPNPDLALAMATFKKLGEEELPDAKRDASLGLGQTTLALTADESITLEARIALLAEARVHFTDVLTNHPDSLAADQAVIHIASSYNMPFVMETAGEFAAPDDATAHRAIAALDARLKQNKRPEMRPVLFMLMGHIHLQLGESREAVSALREAVGEIKVPRTREQLVWQIARLCDRDLKDKKLALEYYELFAREAERSVLRYRAIQKAEKLRAELKESGGE